MTERPIDLEATVKLLNRLGLHGITTTEEADALFALAEALPALIQDGKRLDGMIRYSTTVSSVPTINGTEYWVSFRLTPRLSGTTNNHASPREAIDEALERCAQPSEETTG